MSVITATSPSSIQSENINITETLFADDLYERVMLSVFNLGKPTVSQLYRLHQHELSNDRDMHRIVTFLNNKKHQLLTRIKPVDIENTGYNLAHSYLDTTKSRRQIEKHFQVPFRRIPATPSRNIIFLYHDRGLVDELVSFELTAHTHKLLFAYETLYTADGKYVFPKLLIEHENHIHGIRPEPDKVIFINGHHIVVEHDCGQETIGIGHVIRDATVARKYLVYDALLRSNVLTELKWKKVVYLYIIEGKKRTKASTDSRIESCIDAIPECAESKKIYFASRAALLDFGDDLSTFRFTRGDGIQTVLPCFKNRVNSC